MNKRDYAAYLLGRMPEGKLDYVIAYMEGALIPDAQTVAETAETAETAEAPAEEMTKETSEADQTEAVDSMKLFEDPELTEEMMNGPLASLFRNTRAIQQQSDETDEIYAALERMAVLGMDDDMMSGMGSVEGLEGLEDLKDDEPDEEQAPETPLNFFADAGLEDKIMSSPIAGMYKDAQSADENSDEDEEEFYAALERMARLELQAYKDGLK